MRGIGEKLSAFFWLLCILSVPVFSEVPTYSAEIEFSNDYLRKGDYGPGWEYAYDRKNGRNDAARDQYEVWIRNRCLQARCQVEKIADESGLNYLKVSYDNGFHFLVTLDPGILEAKTKPATLEELRANQQRLQSDLFEGMQAIGLSGSRQFNAGHIHIGLHSAFKDDPLLLRNFIVDYNNHTELATGAMSTYDRYNAIPMAFQHQWLRDRYRKLLNQLDSGKLTMREFLGKLDWAINHAPKPYQHHYNSKFVALNIYRTVDRNIPDAQRTVEVRALSGNETAEELIKTVTLLEKRMDYLRTVREPMAYIDQRVQNKAEKGRRFWNYIAKAGLEPLDYAFMIEDPAIKAFFKAPQPNCRSAVMGLLPPP